LLRSKFDLLHRVDVCPLRGHVDLLRSKFEEGVVAPLAFAPQAARSLRDLVGRPASRRLDGVWALLRRAPVAPAGRASAGL